MKKSLLIIIAIIAALGASGCSYNELTTLQQEVKGSWAKVESSLQRRADLIPNLVEAAKMAGIQEQEVFGQIADARSKLLGASSAAGLGAGGDKTPEQKQAILDANSSFGGTIGRLLVLQEQYPVLRSNDNFMKLQDELSATENRINVARLDYTDWVTKYNATRNSFPTVITASLFGFKEEPFFKAEEGTKIAPKIDSNSLRKTSAPTSTAPAAPAAAPSAVPVATPMAANSTAAPANR